MKLRIPVRCPPGRGRLGRSCTQSRNHELIARICQRGGIFETRTAVATTITPKIPVKKNNPRNIQVPVDAKFTCRSAGTWRLVHNVPSTARKPPAIRFRPTLRYSAARRGLELNIQAATAGLTNAAAYIRPWKASTRQGQKRVRASGATSRPIHTLTQATQRRLSIRSFHDNHH